MMILTALCDSDISDGSSGGNHSGEGDSNRLLNGREDDSGSAGGDRSRGEGGRYCTNELSLTSFRGINPLSITSQYRIRIGDHFNSVFSGVINRDEVMRVCGV